MSADARKLANKASDPTQALIEAALALLRQAIQVLKVLSDEQLQKESSLSPGSTTGKHIRHMKEYYAQLVESCSRDLKSEAIQLTYDKRMRNSPMETSCKAAHAELEQLINDIQAIVPQCPLDKLVRLDAATPQLVAVESSFGRELWFASLHATHHLALVRLILASETNVDLPDDFGVAPSTLVFRKQNSSKL